MIDTTKLDKDTQNTQSILHENEHSIPAQVTQVLTNLTHPSLTNEMIYKESV